MSVYVLLLLNDLIPKELTFVNTRLMFLIFGGERHFASVPASQPANLSEYTDKARAVS